MVNCLGKAVCVFAQNGKNDLSDFFQALVPSGRQTSFTDSPEVPLQVDVKMDMTHFHHLRSNNFAEVPLWWLQQAAVLVAVREHGMRARRWLQECLQDPQLVLSCGQTICSSHSTSALCPTACTAKCSIMTTALALDLQCSHSASHSGCH